MDIDFYLSPAERKEMGGTPISLRRGRKHDWGRLDLREANVFNKPKTRGIINIGTRD